MYLPLRNYYNPINAKTNNVNLTKLIWNNINYIFSVIKYLKNIVSHYIIKKHHIKKLMNILNEIKSQKNTLNFFLTTNLTRAILQVNNATGHNLWYNCIRFRRGCVKYSSVPSNMKFQMRAIARHSSRRMSLVVRDNWLTMKILAGRWTHTRVPGVSNGCQT